MIIGQPRVLRVMGCAITVGSPEGQEEVTGPTSSLSEDKKRVRAWGVPVLLANEHHTSTKASKTLMVSALGSALGRSARVMLDLGSECSLIHNSLLEGCNIAHRASRLKVHWDGGSLYHKGEKLVWS